MELGEVIENKIQQCCVPVDNILSLDANYWSRQYDNKTTNWDLGMASPALVHFVNTIANKQCRILIPGCGNAYEAEYLLSQGFENITLIDIAPTLVAQLKEKYEDNKNIRIVLGDFFELEGNYDVILEQTFFCAISPILRSVYASKMRELLSDDGLLAGVLFNRIFEFDGPPFGGSIQEYLLIFENAGLTVLEMSPTNMSVLPRLNSEAFFKVKKSNKSIPENATVTNTCSIK